jgi:DUF3102 family protein
MLPAAHEAPSRYQVHMVPAHEPSGSTLIFGDVGFPKCTGPVPSRALADIEKDLGALVKAQRRNIFKMGALLIAAKARVLHGEWLPWLQKHFGASESTANNYMGAAAYLARNPNVGDLKLSMGAVYWLTGAGSGNLAAKISGKRPPYEQGVLRGCSQEAQEEPVISPQPAPWHS